MLKKKKIIPLPRKLDTPLQGNLTTVTILTKPLAYLITLVLLFTLWHVAAVKLDLAMLPTPLEALASMSHLFSSGSILGHLFASFSRIFLAIAISFVLGLPLGLLIGYERLFERVLSPLVYLLYPIPKIVFLPLIMVFLGLGEVSKIFLIFFILFFQVVVTTRDAVKKIPSQMLDSFYALGGKRRQAYVHVLLPAALADVLTMLRQSVGMAFAVLFLAETYSSRLSGLGGLGYNIMDAYGRAEYPEMYATILIMAALGVIFFLVIDLLEWRFCRWRR